MTRTKKLSHAAQTRQLARDATEAAARAQQAEYDKARSDAQEARARVKREIDKIFSEQWAPQIEDAAKKQQSSTLIAITSYDGQGHAQLAPYHDALIAQGIEYLKKKGYEARSKSEFSPRVGSDDDYGNQTHIYIEVTW